MTKSAITTEAFTLGQQIMGFVLGVPFFLGSLLLLGAGRIATHSKTWGEWAIGYLLFVVIPAAVCLSSALATLVAPQGQGKSYAKSPAIGYIAFLLSFVILLSSMILYAAWPLTVGHGIWPAFARSPLGPPVAMMLGAVLLVPGAGTAGYAVGCSTRRRPASITARFLRFCWKMSRKRPLDSTVVPLS